MATSKAAERSGPFNPDALRLKPKVQVVGDIPTVVAPSPSQKRRQKRRFIKGPISWGWFVALRKLRTGGALSLAFAIKRKSDTSGEKWTKIPASLMLDLGITPSEKSRALAELEKAGFVEIQRRSGRPSLVRLVPWTDDDG